MSSSSSRSADDESARQTIRRLVVPVYLPWLATGLANAILLPTLPLYLLQEDLSYGATTFILAAAGIGAAAGGLPTSGLLSRFGERPALLAALLLTSIAAALTGFTTAAAALFCLQLVMGTASVVSRLVHQTHVVRTVSVGNRGRALATVGGTMRGAAFVGPLAGGFVAEQFGFASAFVLAGVVAAVGLIPGAAPRDDVDTTPASEGGPATVGVWTAIRRHWRLLLRTSVGPTLIMTVRFGRLVILPLIGDSLGMSTAEVGVLVAISTGADLLLFPVAGVLMDRFGRLAAIVPAFSLMGVGLLLLAAAGSSTAVVIAGAVIGVGNGLSAGTMLTVSSDVAPADAPAPFIAAFSTINDSGRFFGPVIVGWVGDSAGLDASALTLAIVMFVGVALVVALIGETS